MSFMTYKLFLTNIGSVFDGVTMPWNKKYDKVSGFVVLMAGAAHAPICLQFVCNLFAMCFLCLLLTSSASLITSSD